MTQNKMRVVVLFCRNLCLQVSAFVCFSLIPSAFAQIPTDDLAQKLLEYKTPNLSARESVNIEGGISRDELNKYRRIFALQARAKWKEADQQIALLYDERLMGYVLQQRYLHAVGYRASYDELRRWMNLYADHAGAKDIYHLALNLKPKEGGGSLTAPLSVDITHRYIDLTAKPRALYGDDTRITFSQQSAFQNMAVEIRDKIRSERPTQALEVLESNNDHLTGLDYNRLKSRISASYMHEGKLEAAMSLAKEAVSDVGLKVPLGAWVAGLSAWRLGHIEDAAHYFEITASSEYANVWTRAAGAYWAARAHMRLGHFDAVSLWLNRAAASPRTFYGILGARAISSKMNFDWSVPPLDPPRRDLLMLYPSAVRGMALLELGRLDEAEYEFHFLEKSEVVDVRRALISLAHQIGNAGMVWRAGSYVLYKDENADVPIAALYPQMGWAVADADNHVDRALLHALIRQESRFNPAAGNPSGAMGLMQLLPSTARHVIGDKIYDEAGGDVMLLSPLFNITAGQKYINRIFSRFDPDQNLFDLLIAWNAGPGNLARWKSNLGDMQDPLLFIESIPVAETRAFVERVMTNYWLYRNRFGQDTPSLDEVVSGKWPIYVSQERE